MYEHFRTTAPLCKDCCLPELAICALTGACTFSTASILSELLYLRSEPFLPHLGAPRSLQLPPSRPSNWRLTCLPSSRRVLECASLCFKRGADANMLLSCCGRSRISILDTDHLGAVGVIIPGCAEQANLCQLLGTLSLCYEPHLANSTSQPTNPCDAEQHLLLLTEPNVRFWIFITSLRILGQVNISPLKFLDTCSKWFCRYVVVMAFQLLMSFEFLRLCP
jgi:hypothetical protein